MAEYGDISGTVAATLEKQALRHAQPTLILDIGAKKMSLPKNDTKTLRARRARPYAAAATALTEGSPPAATELLYDEIDIVIDQYGAFTTVTDILVDLHTTPVLGDINKLNAEQAARTKEALLWGKLAEGTTIQYAGGESAVIDVNTEFTKADQALAVRTLNRNKAKKFTSITKGGVRENTFPVEASYICFAHTDAENIIRNIEGFIPVARYGSGSAVHEMELGTVDSVRYVLSADLSPAADAATNTTLNGMISTTGTVADVYTAIYCGMDAYTCMNLAGKGMFTPVVRSVGKPTDTDPLGQVGSVGWKMYSGEEILNNDWMVVMHHAVSQIPS